jgi:hypothetical protein
MRGALLPLPNTPSLRGAQLKHRDFTLPIGILPTEGHIHIIPNIYLLTIHDYLLVQFDITYPFERASLDRKIQSSILTINMRGKEKWRITG